MTQLKQSDLKPLREKWYKESFGRCEASGAEIPFEDSVIDHDHKTGLCRGVLHKSVNAFEGKVLKDFTRLGLHNTGISLPALLRVLAEYYTNNRSSEGLVHPASRPRQPVLQKSSYKSLVKVSTVKVPAYTGKLTKKLNTLFQRFNIVPKFYKD